MSLNATAEYNPKLGGTISSFHLPHATQSVFVLITKPLGDTKLSYAINHIIFHSS